MRPFLKRALRASLAFSRRYSLLLLLLFSGLLALQLYWLSHNFRFDSDLKALFRGSDPVVQQLEKLSGRIGGYSTAEIVSHSDTKEKNIAFLAALKADIEKSELVRFVEFERDVTYLEEHALLYVSQEDLDAAEQEVRDRIAQEVEKGLSLDEEAPADGTATKSADDGTIDQEIDRILDRIADAKGKNSIQRYLNAENDKYIAMQVRPAGGDMNIDASRRLVAFLEARIAAVDPAKYGVEAEVGGYYRHRIQEVEAIGSDLFGSILVCLLLLITAIVVYYRSFWAVPIIFFPLVFGVVTGIVAAQNVVGTFNLISAFSFAMLFGIGIENAIHLFSRYCEHKKEENDPLETLVKVYENMAYPLISSASISVLAFATLALIPFKGFADFGMVASAGLATSIFSIFILLPTLIFSIERFFDIKVGPRPINFLGTGYLFLVKRPALMFIPVAALLFSIGAIFFIPFEYQLDKLTFESKYDPTRLYNRYVDAVRLEPHNPSSQGMPAFYLADSLEEAKEVTDALVALKKEQGKEKRRGTIKTVTSLYTFVPADQEEKLATIARIKRMLERKMNLLSDAQKARVDKEIMPLLSVDTPIEADKLPGWIKDKLREKDGSWGKFVTVTFVGNKSNVKSVLELKESYGVIHGKQKDYELFAPYLLTANIKKVLDRDVPLAVMLAFGTVFLVLLFVFRSVRSALIVFAPFLTGILWMVGVAFVAGIKFNLFNMVIMPTIIGIAIDNCIHIYSRYKEEGADRLPFVMQMTGGAVLLTVVTNFIGFASNAYGSHRGITSIGVMASIAITTVAVSSLIVYPAALTLLQHWTDRRKKS
ncbi:MAG TPA: MMPL family transporter [bacterium]|nr:MMPL family transporter [bacterium]